MDNTNRVTDGGTFILLFPSCRDEEESSLPKLFLSANRSSRICSPLSVPPPLPNLCVVIGKQGKLSCWDWK